MNNISIVGVCECSDLDRKVRLNDGSLMIQKEKENVIGAYLIIPFRDNKNKYSGDNTYAYCSLINLDTGKLAFEERCSRSTTERRVLRHLTRAGYQYPYNPDSHNEDCKFQNMRIQVYTNDNYKMNLELKDELTSN